MEEINLKSRKNKTCWECVFLKLDSSCQRPSRQGLTEKWIIGNPLEHESCDEYIESPYLVKESAG